MSHKLGRLLKCEGRLFEVMINDLESATGSTAVDVNLLGMLMTQTNAKIRQLGFSSSDVTLAELAVALEQKYQQAVANLATNSDQELKKNPALINTGQVFELSELLLLRILRTLPPTGLMRRCGVAEVSELLNQITASEIMVSLTKTEAADWLHKFRQQVAILERGYFDFLPLKVQPMTGNLKKLFSSEPIMYDQLSATVFVNTVDSGEWLIQLATVLKQRIFRSNQLALIFSAQHFHAQLQKWLINEPNFSWTLAGNIIPRSSIYSTLAETKSLLYQRVKQDFNWLAQKINTFDAYQWLVSQLSDSFWTDTEYLLFSDDEKVISFNLLDNYFSSFKQTQETRFAEEKLWNLLIEKYLQNQNLTDQLFLQIESKIKN
ncbi:MAG: hypothetical protein Q3996_01270 [Candidatus Saccharibacteria bacterium]|nr:hypothetical protein [Candidatus Saccharibacteria bacterium]